MKSNSNNNSKPKLVTTFRSTTPAVEPVVKSNKTWKTINTTAKSLSNIISPQYNPLSPPVISIRHTSNRSNDNTNKTKSSQVSRKLPVDRYSKVLHNNVHTTRSHSASTNTSGINSPLLSNHSLLSINNSPVQLGTPATGIQLTKLLHTQQLQHNDNDMSDSDTPSVTSSIDNELQRNNRSNQLYNAVLNSLTNSGTNIQSSIDTIRSSHHRLMSGSSDTSTSNIRYSTSRLRNIKDDSKHNDSDSENISDVESVADEFSDLDNNDADDSSMANNHYKSITSQYQRVLSADRIEPVAVAIERRKKFKKFGDAIHDGRLYRTDISQSIRDINTGVLLSLAPLPQKSDHNDDDKSSASTTTQLDSIELKLYPQQLHHNVDNTLDVLNKQLTSLVTNTSHSLVKCSNCHTVGHFSRQCKLSKQRHNSITNTSTESSHNNDQLPTCSIRNNNKHSTNNAMATSNITDIQINNLPPETTKNDIHTLCLYFGRIKRVTLPVDRNGHCKSVAYVTYIKSSDALNAIQSLHQYTYGNCILSVSPSKQY